MFSKTLNNFLSGVKANSQDMLRLRHFLVFVVFGLPTMAVYGVYNYVNGQPGLAVVILISGISLAVGAVLQIRNPSGSVVFRLCTIVYSMMLLYAYVLGGDGGSKSLWLFTFPLIVFFLLGKKEGAIWTLLLFVSVIFLRYLPSATLEIYGYSDDFFVRLLSVYVIVSFVSAWFEHFRTSYFVMNQLGNEKFVEILENSRDILYRRDFRFGRYDYISDAFNRELGYSQKETRELVFQGVESLIHPDDRPAHRQYLEKILKSSKGDVTENIEYRMRHKNGNYLWFSDKATVMYDSEGQPDHMIGINREISEFRMTRLALEKSQEQLLTILNSLDAHVYVADMESYRILFVNDSMQRDFGRNLIGGYCWKEFCNFDGPCDFCTNKKLLDEEDQPTGVHEWENYNPTVSRWYRNYDRAIQWIDGRWVRLQIAIDITRNKDIEEERKKTEEIVQRNRQLEAIGSLAGGIAHDFNNILQVITGNAELIKDEDGLTADGHHCLKEIKAASAKARELANRLISFSPSGKTPATSIETAVFLQELILLNINTEKVHLDLQVDPAVWNFFANKRQLMTAFTNVLTNSLESLGEEGFLGITASNYTGSELRQLNGVKISEGKFVKITITDNGCGIESHDLSRVFNPYFSTKEVSAIKGVGLGLSIAHSIINRNDGELTIESQKDKGTTVRFYIPAAL